MSLVNYRVEDDVAVIAMDDGKVNVLSPAMLAELNGAFDEAEGSGHAVVLTGRAGLFSGGFDLKVLSAGGAPAAQMLLSGFELAQRVMTLRTPVVVACSGHSVAMGTFLCLSGDYRLGIDGPYRIVVNEVAIGMVLPHGTIELCRHRLAPQFLTRALTQAEPFSGASAVSAGFFDRVVEEAQLMETALETARRLGAYDRRAWIVTKGRVQAGALAAVRAGFEQDQRDGLERGLAGDGAA